MKLLGSLEVAALASAVVRLKTMNVEDVKKSLRRRRTIRRLRRLRRKMA